MITTRSCSKRPHPTQFCKRLAPAFSAVTAVLMSVALVCPVAAEQQSVAPRYDRRVLSDIARDVLSREASGGTQSVPTTLPAAETEPEMAVTDAVPDTPSQAASIAPPRATIPVAIPRGAAATPDPTPEAAAAGYESNSWRARPHAARGLGFASGVLPPASGLDPALNDHAANALRAQGHQFVYGFVLLRGRLDEALENKLADLGVVFLGPHDDHHKARLPVGSLRAIAALPEVNWVGMSAREQKQSPELAALRGSRTRAAVVTTRRRSPSSSISSRTTRAATSGASWRPPASPSGNTTRTSTSIARSSRVPSSTGSPHWISCCTWS